MEHINKKHLRRISFWGRFVGFLTAIAGAVIALQGLFTTVVGVIPGIITVLLARFIFITGQQAKKILETNQHDTYALEQLLGSYSWFLLVNGILIIVVILFYIIFFAFFAS